MGEAEIEPAINSFACNFHSIAWHKVEHYASGKK
jgi:hypothetical protein